MTTEKSGRGTEARAHGRENELTCQENGIEREPRALADRQRRSSNRCPRKSLASASAAAEESARTVRENVATGLISPLEYRVSQTLF
jgi:hypothetical protein